jgi:hypothetical protein
MSVAERHDEHLMESGPETQGPEAAGLLHRFHRSTPLIPVIGTVVDLAGFGEAPIHFKSADTEYLLLSEVAEALGWPLTKAHAWTELQHSHAVRDQRREDEERDDGRLGWHYVRGYVDLGFFMTMPDPGAKPDAGGKHWSYAGDWLISKDRLPLLLLSSPWSKEFMDNTLPAFGHAMRETWGDKLRDIPTVTGDGQPTGGNAYDDLFTTDGLTRDEALRRARRGPALDDQP